MNRTSPKEPRTGNEGDERETEREGSEWISKRLVELETTMGRLDEERERMKLEIRELRDRLEEAEWQNKRMEEKIEARIQEVEERQTRLEDGGGGGGGGGGVGGIETQRPSETSDDRLKRIEERLDLREREAEKSREDRNRVSEGTVESGGHRAERRQRWVILTDSNGRGTTEDSIKNHVPREDKDKFRAEIEVTYTLDEAYRRVESQSIEVAGAKVIVDCLTNDVRG